MRRLCLAVVVLALAPCVYAQERCGIAKDLVVRVRERLAQGAAPSDYLDLVELLKQATQICMSEGDAWYYRSLLERRLGHGPLADLAASKAKLFDSEALSLGLDPFVPAAPARTAAASGTPATLGEVHDKWALVVGVGSFRDTRVPRLRYTAKDARDMAALLTDERYGRFRPDHVHLLTDDQATTTHIKAELNWLARSAGKDDLVVLYVSSHGSPREMDTAGVSYVVTYDTDIQSPDTLYATSLPMVDLADAVRTRIKAQRAAVFLDTCFSGAAASGAKDIHLELTGVGVSKEAVERIKQGAGRVIVTASSANERSYESERLGNGIFTHFLLDALRQDRGLVPLDQAFAFVREKVSQTVSAEQHASQVPTLTKSDQGASLVIGAPVP